MEVILQQFANLSVLIYIVTTMLSMGLNFFPKQFFTVHIANELESFLESFLVLLVFLGFFPEQQ